MSIKNTQIQAIVLIFLTSIVAFATSIRTDHFSVAGYNSYSDNTEKLELSQLFEQWMQEHEKTYAKPEDKTRRFENFVKNFEFVHKWNADRENGSHVVELNNFADLSYEEFKDKYLMSNIHMERRRERRNQRRNEGCNAPQFLDWRTQGVITPVKNQGQCGSCWSFSSTGAIEAINAIKSKQLVSLSEQELVDCVTMSSGCQGGYMSDAFDWVVNNGGINTESGYPYTATKGSCNIQQAENKLVTIDGYEDVEPKDEALLCALLKQPISVAISAHVRDFMLYTGGIYDGNCSNDPIDITHAVLLVGYGSENGTDYWILKNSWSTKWGDQGYMYMKRDKSLPFGKCAILAMASYPTKKHGHFVYINNHASSSRVSSFWGTCILMCILFFNCCLFFLLEFERLF
ncbi:Cysteine protease [Rhynchospora pubera]|uniref:Cysteine protease n=1 Tax=Rhynchospora pubera TaxID=906938 RepID=A0AAV8CS74_9POAL|nr:Cysteine protease [Rhynchospora pubera]